MVSIQWSKDFDAYTEGKIPLHRVRCVLCEKAPCECPEFGSPEYLALIQRAHETK